MTNGQILDEQHGQVAGDAERHFGQHRVDVGIPERVPRSQRLADVDHQHDHRSADSKRIRRTTAVLITARSSSSSEDVEQEAGEKRSRTEGDHGEIEEDPQPEREAVVHVGLVEAVNETAAAA